MSKELVESILNKNLVEAEGLFNDRMNVIREQKLYEAKRDVAAQMYEAEGKYGQYMSKDDWAEYRKKHPSMGMYDVPGKKPGTIKKGKPSTHEKTASGGLTKKGIETRRKKGYLPAFAALKSKEFIDKVIHYHKTGEVTEAIYQPGELDPKSVEQRIKAAKAKPAPGAFGVTPKKGEGRHDLKWMTPKKRRELLDARRAAKVSELEKTRPEKADIVKARIAKAKGRDVLNVIGKSASETMGVKGRPATFKDAIKHVAGALVAGKS